MEKQEVAGAPGRGFSWVTPGGGLGGAGGLHELQVMVAPAQACPAGGPVGMVEDLQPYFQPVSGSELLG